MAGYTVKQGIFAEFINNRPDQKRFRRVAEGDSQFRCYMFSGQASHLYEIVKDNAAPYIATPIGGGVIEITGTGRQEPRILQSGSCGIIFHTGL